MSTSKTYTVVVTTTYRVHADDPEQAQLAVTEVIRGGIFNDNVTITSQQAQMYEPEGNGLSMTYFRLGNEQLG